MVSYDQIYAACECYVLVNFCRMIPEFDNLYLDMNGIIHNCSHPNDEDVHLRIPEENIFRDIFHYIDFLFRMIKPCRVFFMAIDGVAPRAKMNQQRGRRFRSARLAEEQEAEAIRQGEKLPSEERFDSNCITPGTEFMARLHEQLKYFVSVKVSTDPLWQRKGLHIYLSGHDVPGEGEHKIMDFIRHIRSQPQYDAETRHCLYGLDADLMMLGLSTHELRFSLLRDYLDEEFLDLKNKLKDHPHITYDLECVIDDWILMNILVGNDFVPHLPNLHIVKGALPMLYRTYMDVLPNLDGYLNESGHLNLKRFEVFIRRLSLFDLDQFRDTYDDMKYKASKTGKNIVLGEKMFDPFIFEDDGIAIEEEELQPISDELKELAKRTEDEIFGDLRNGDGEVTICKEVFPDDDDFFSPDDTEEFRLEFLQHKRNYYLTKCEFKKVDRDAIYEFAKEYVRAIQWVLLYYYKGVSSWGWFYPSHYSPYSSDLRNFGSFQIDFDKGQPFKPFEQLLAVLPSQSKKLLPGCYQWLMTQDNSPILEYYPKKFEQDLNGKRQDWEAVVLIPFIDESKLLEAMENEVLNLSEEEVFRNARGALLCYSYTKEDTGPVKCHRNLFPELEVSHIKLEKINEVSYNPQLLPKGLHSRADIKKIYQGFPSLKSKTFNVRSCICKAEVKVFEFYAREESLIISFEEFEDETDGLKLGKKILGKSVWVNWPHLEAALITALYTRSGKYILGRDNLVIRDPKTTEDAARRTFDAMAKGLVERHLKFRGIRLGNLGVILHGKVMEGRKIRCNNVGNVVIENQWNKLEQPFALKTAIYEERVTEMFYMDNDTARSYLDLFRKGDQVFYLGDKAFGALGVVVGHEKGSGTVVVDLKCPKDSDESNLKLKTGLKQLKSQDFFPPYQAAAMCHISSFALARLTGRVLVSVEKPRKVSKKSSRDRKKLPDTGSLSASDSSESSLEEDFPPLEPEYQKLNIGLDLKFNKTNMEVRGYTSKRDGQWFYSANAVKLVNEYVYNFPDVVELLGRADKNKDVYNAADIFPNDPYGRTFEIVNWLDDRGVRNLPRIPTNCNVLDDDDIENVWKHVATTKNPSLANSTELNIWSVRPNLLYKPGLDKGCIAPIANAQFALLDRVICVDRGASIPLGLRGTVVGIQAPPKSANDDNDESFKTVSADALNSLIIMCDPAQDIFDTNPRKETGNLTELTGSLAKLLGVNGVNQVAETKTVAPVVPKPIITKPKLVKLFPYQVINLTQGSTNLRQDLKKAPLPAKSSNGIDKSSLFNGTVITSKNYAQAAAAKNVNSKPPTKILQRPSLQTAPSKSVQPVVKASNETEPKLILPWPPKPMNHHSITVEQLFAQAAQNKQAHAHAGEQNEKISKPTQILKKSMPVSDVSNDSKNPTKNNLKSQPPAKEEVVVVKKRQPAFADQIKSEQKGITTKVFYNSSLQHPKNRDSNATKSDVKLVNEGNQATTGAQQPQSKNQILNLLCQPKNVERVNTTANRTVASTSTPGVNGHQKVAPETVTHHTHPHPGQFHHPAQMVPLMSLQAGHNAHGSYSHPVFNVNPNMPPQYYVPTPYPVMMPFASAFYPHDGHGQIHAVYPPPQPPQHWTQGRHTATDSAHRYHNTNQNQSVRQSRGSHQSNVFVPLQVSRSMASGDHDSHGQEAIRQKELVVETKKHSVECAQRATENSNHVSQKNTLQDSTVPATQTLKALLGVSTETQSESVPPARKSRLAANFGNQAS
ncbi:5'-3' exoribonuclease 1 [Orchesella cincta]|uniref:5'-3' exoribonuclease 1 n=1 Tax=Orchesella cincta TaxID=48709 RepID=A0A1D2MS83_ORCCI|nr:5'-3' exoribonuclease 1 [Orchesella cincta]